MPAFIEIALSGIRNAAENGSLLKHKEVIYILYNWGKFLEGDYSEPLTWTNNLLDNDENLLVLTEKFIGRSWSTGMGGFGSLSDRVSISSTSVQIENDCKILDVEKFRNRLEQILNNPNSPLDRIVFIKDFIKVWDNQSSRT